MLTLALAVLVSQAQPPLLDPEHPIERIDLELGERRQFHTPGLQRVAVSTGTADCRTIGNSRLEVIGSEVGKFSLLAWFTNGKRVTSLVVVRPAKTELGPYSLKTLPEVIRIAVGERRVLRLSGMEHFTSGGANVDAKAIEGGIELIGHEGGDAHLLVRFKGGLAAVTRVLALPPSALSQELATPVKASIENTGALSVVKFDESLTEVNEVFEVDGGVLLRGKNAHGLAVEVFLQPQ